MPVMSMLEDLARAIAIGGVKRRQRAQTVAEPRQRRRSAALLSSAASSGATSSPPTSRDVFGDARGVAQRLAHAVEQLDAPRGLHEPRVGDGVGRARDQIGGR